MRGVKAWYHVVVGLSVVSVAALAGWGVIGEDHHPERIEAIRYDITASAENDQGLRITETIDQDFGNESRHGPELVIPNDLGLVSDVTARSPDAPDDVSTDPVLTDDGRSATRIRVGDPDRTISGQHRYVISYVLPEARFSGPDLFLDIVAPGDLPIGRLEVVFSGVSLDSPVCTQGPPGSDDECELLDTSPIRVLLEDVSKEDAVTISGEVLTWEAGDAAPEVPIPERRSEQRGRAVGAVTGAGALTAAATYLWARRRGSNEVVGSSPAEAAHGVATPGPGTSRTVSDAELAEMATIEFAPPRGIEPWQGAVVLNEKLDDSTVTAWFSGAIADDILEIEKHDGVPRLRHGSKADGADDQTANILRIMFGNREVVDLDGYDAQFAAAWTQVAKRQDQWIASSGWWAPRLPRRDRPTGGGCGALVVLVPVLVAGLLGSIFLKALLGSIGGLVTGVVVGIGLPFLVARVAYAPLLLRRTANGSAYALQVASFRRFLTESEGQHVKWAWDNGLLRQYSAWAVALDAADAWKDAMERTGVPAAEIETGSPLLVHSMGGSFRSSHTQPVESGSSSGGSSSFSSGSFSSSSGGGGGGSSHGSW